VRQYSRSSGKPQQGHSDYGAKLFRPALLPILRGRASRKKYRALFLEAVRLYLSFSLALNLV